MKRGAWKITLNWVKGKSVWILYIYDWTAFVNNTHLHLFWELLGLHMEKAITRIWKTRSGLGDPQPQKPPGCLSLMFYRKYSQCMPTKFTTFLPSLFSPHTILCFLLIILVWVLSRFDACNSLCALSMSEITTITEGQAGKFRNFPAAKSKVKKQSVKRLHTGKWLFSNKHFVILFLAKAYSSGNSFSRC